MKQTKLSLPDFGREFSALDMGDTRLNKRCRLIRGKIRKSPAAPFPQTMKTNNDIEAFYRFLRNPRVDMEPLLTPHFGETAKRAREEDGDVLVCHDTTPFCPNSASKKGGFDEITSKTYGLNIHAALAFSLDTGLPLGLLDGQIVNPPPPKEYVDENGDVKELTSHQIFHHPKKQSRRWFETVSRVETRVGSDRRLVHVLDSEADSYEAFAHLANYRFVCRLKHDRVAKSADNQEYKKLFDLLDGAPLFKKRTITISRRKKARQPKRSKTSPARKKRMAKLEIRAMRVEIKRPHHLSHPFPKSLSFFAVAVREPKPPKDCEPVSWNLLTSEPAATAEQVEAVVDKYCDRWRIEDYFDVLKNGCALSERLPESRESATVVIALLLPMAWELLWLRQAARLNPKASADLIFSKERLRILRAQLPKGTLPPRPSVSHVLNAIALLGGHMPRHGPAGWRVLARGYKEFLDFERGWQAARESLD